MLRPIRNLGENPMSVMRDLPKLALLTIMSLLVGVLMISLTGVYMLAMAVCYVMCGLFLTCAAMAFLMWVLSGQPEIWAGMLHALGDGLVFGAIVCAVQSVRLVSALNAVSNGQSLRPP